LKQAFWKSEFLQLGAGRLVSYFKARFNLLANPAFVE